MSDSDASTLRCEACGRALTGADAVCGCDESRAARALGAAQNLDSQLARAEAAAPFRCPACQRRFAAVQLRRVPIMPPPPWYRLTEFSARGCPHCRTPLASRHLPLRFQSTLLPMSLILVAVLLRPVLRLAGVDERYISALAITVMVVTLAVMLYIAIVGAWRARGDQDSYVRDPRYSPPS